MTYLLVSHFPLARRNGVTTYVRNVLRFLRGQGVDVACLANQHGAPLEDFRRLVRDVITSRYRPDEVLVEAPELGGATRLVPDPYRVHVRLHSPNAVWQRYDGRPVDMAGFQAELDVVRRAHVVSCGSFALVRELAPHLDAGAVHVYKNLPPHPDASGTAPVAKTLDIVFMGNFSHIKGVDFLNPLLSRLPAHLAAVLVGRDSDGFEVDPSVRCRVSVGAHLPGPERLRLLAQARVVLSLSRFENCSMLVLEALAAGSVVAGWRVGGHAEIASSRLLRLAPLGDIDALAALVMRAVQEEYPSRAEFRAATLALAEDFHRGWRRVWEVAAGATAPPVYRGLDWSNRPPEGAALRGVAGAPGEV